MMKNCAKFNENYFFLPKIKTFFVEICYLILAGQFKSFMGKILNFTSVPWVFVSFCQKNVSDFSINSREKFSNENDIIIDAEL